MIAVVLILCLLMLGALFFALRYEKEAKRGKEHGELQESLWAAMRRGAARDLRRVTRRGTDS